MSTHDCAPECIVITSGEPAGIGIDIILSLFAQKNFPCHHFLILGDAKVFQARKAALMSELEIHVVQGTPTSAHMLQTQLQKNTLNILQHTCAQSVQAGELNVANAPYVMHMLDTAIALCSDKICAAMVTCPIQKSVLIEAGFNIQGHTEYLAEQCGVEKVVMLLANQHLKVALATTHLPLKEVSAALNQNMLMEQLHIIHNELQRKFGITQPCIYVCGLNPHAGENGHLGREEIEIIAPALAALREQGINVVGPLSADTIFSEHNRKQADVFFAMYHDQGLPVLKALGFGDSINITLGLPIIRTSVDHGTALELAGTGKASHQSLLRAIEQAQLMVNACA